MLIVVASITACVVFVMPVMSVHLNDGEPSMLFVRGFNLMEFSAWGCVPLLSPLLVLAIVFGRQARSEQEKELILLLIATIVSYVHSFNMAKAWLESLGGSLITFHSGAFLIPSAFALVLLLWIASKILSYKRIIEMDEEDLPF